jgi:hypothetical protein
METVRMIGIALLSGLGGYAGGIPLGIFLIEQFSDNPHDKPEEAAVTGAFVVGPIVALLAAVSGAILYEHYRRSA